MTALRRILKYTPAVVLGLLVVAWGISEFANYHRALGCVLCGVEGGSIFLVIVDRTYPEQGLGVEQLPRGMQFTTNYLLGQLQVWGNWKLASQNFKAAGAVPLPFLITVGIPLAVGPFLSFRFPLWHYLAYTALVGVELAYYLQWQK